ncbi:MAG: phage scaffolding protein [Lachnospiraceae bacterium]
MKRKDLEDLGIEKENIDKIMDWNGADIEAEKAKTTAAEGERDNYKSQLDTATEELNKLKDMKPEEMQETITKLQNDLKAKDDEYAAKEAQRLFDDSLDKAITAAGGRNPKAIRGMLDLKTLQESKDQTEDIKKALETIKESDAYLFGVNEPINNPVGPTSGGGGIDATTAAMRAAAGLPPVKE